MFSSLLDVHFIIITALCRWISRYFNVIIFYCFETNIFFWKFWHHSHHWRMQKRERMTSSRGCRFWYFTHFLKLNFILCKTWYSKFHFLLIRPRNRRKKDLHCFHSCLKCWFWKAFHVIKIWRLFWDLEHVYNYHCTWWVFVQFDASVVHERFNSAIFKIEFD